MFRNVRKVLMNEVLRRRIRIVPNIFGCRVVCGFLVRVGGMMDVSWRDGMAILWSGRDDWRCGMSWWVVG